MHRIRLLILTILVTALLVIFAGLALAQSGITNFTNVVVTGDLIAGDDVTAGASVTVGGVAVYQRQTPITVTMNGYITPTGSYQPLTSAGTVGTSHIATTTLGAGSLLLLVNESATTITISDTADLLLGGDRALGQNDTLLLIHNGDGWVEIATTNN